MAPVLLIINADDFGLADDTNSGIVDAFEHGLVRSASLLVNGPAADGAVNQARAHRALEVGLHLNVTDGVCTTSTRQVPLLVDAEGRFRFDSSNPARELLHFREMAGDPRMRAQVRIEFLSQVERFCRTGLTLGHLNVHHYVALLRPELFEIYLRIAEEARVPFRGLVFPMVHLLETTESDLARLVRLQHAGGASPAISISNLLDAAHDRPGPGQYVRLMLAKLTELRGQPDLTSIEVICHPTRMTRRARRDSYFWARRLESAFVHSRSVSRFLESSGWRLGGYRALDRLEP